MGIKLSVWGDFACFSRAEMKVERVSYDAHHALRRAGDRRSDLLEAGDPLADHAHPRPQSDPVHVAPAKRGRLARSRRGPSRRP